MNKITRTIREQVTQRIRDDVVSGSFDPGQALRETEFAERYGVSRGPVRDAFLQLSQEGFLSYEANRGVTVKEPPQAEHRDLIVSLRKQVELFVLNRGFDTITDAARLELQQLTDELKRECKAKNVAEIAKCDIKFHQTILEACGGSDFLTIWRWLCSQMMLTYARLENYMDIHGEHVRVLDGILNNNQEETIAALEANIR
ncbi:MAG: GntR family transcriptional regulator [Pirellulales bacterium]